ncbi:MAG: hypothetical protein AB7T06_19675 [Kofleriaceae bacterium]
MVVGIEHLLAIANGTIREGKMVINARGVVFGPVSTQHRDLRADGIRYADDYQGNALAAMLAPNRIELRFHKAFTDVQVVELIRRLTSEASLAFLAHWRVTYQGRDLSL